MAELIKLNEHRLLNGDATNQDDVKQLIGDNKVNLLLTDPPYGISIVNTTREREREREQLEQSEEQNHQPSTRYSRNTCKTRIPQRGGGTKYGKVGKPRRCTAKTL